MKLGVSPGLWEKKFPLIQTLFYFLFDLGFDSQGGLYQQFILSDKIVNRIAAIVVR